MCLIKKKPCRLQHGCSLAVESTDGFMGGVVRINNPFLANFPLILTGISRHISKLHDIIIKEKKLLSKGKMLATLL